MKKTIILAALLMALTTAPASAWNLFGKVKEKITGANTYTPPAAPDSAQMQEILDDLMERNPYFDKSVDISDPLYEWSEMDSKLAKVQLTSGGLLLESKKDEITAFSIAELPISLEENSEFVFGATFTGVKPNENKSVGLIFDYEDARNYKGIAVFKKQFNYFVVKDGIATPIKTGLVKMKGNVLTLLMVRKNGKIEFLLDGLEICTAKRVSITSPIFGMFVQGKMKAIVPEFFMGNILPEETEQSTTDN